MLTPLILSSLAAALFAAEPQLEIAPDSGRLPARKAEGLFQRLVLPDLLKAGYTRDEETGALGAAKGAFTRKGASQAAVRYIVGVASHNDNPHGVAIIERGKLVGRLEFEGPMGGSIASLPDIDRDGLSELVLRDGTTGQGYSAELITILELPGGKVRKLGLFKVHEDDCGAAEEGKGTRKDSRIFVRPGRTPVFTKDVSSGPCDGAVKTPGVSSPAEPEKDESEYRFVRPARPARRVK